MTKANSSVAAYRARMANNGLVRLEVSVRQEDASLVRAVAAALSDPARRTEVRRHLQQGFAEPPKVSLKALLASAPFDGIDLERSREPGRELDL